jgi:hypothetical protein
MTDDRTSNAGNYGDILKHGALVRLAQLAAKRAIRGPVTYIDTHARCVHSPWNNPLKWKQRINAQLGRHSAYTEYVRMEKERLDADEPYLCSVGLALEIVSDRNYYSILNEPDEEARFELQQQVRQAGYRADYVLEDISELQDIEPPRGEDEDEDDHAAGSHLVMADLEEHGLEAWDEISKGIGHFTEAETEGIVEVFHVADDAPDWPDAPTHYSGPIATLHDAPFHLAAYATDPMIDRTHAQLENLGWEIHSDE